MSGADKTLTKKQGDVLLFIKQYIAAHKYPPAIRDIADFFKMSAKGAYDHIRALERKQAITRMPKISRGILINDRRE